MLEMRLAGPLSQRILIYGHDAALLETRRMLLAVNGFDVDAAVNEHEFQSRIAQSNPPYGVWILCHSLPQKERPAVQALAIEMAAPFYQLESFVAPPDFLEKVAEALK
jgi:hypothetical protein